MHINKLICLKSFLIKARAKEYVYLIPITFLIATFILIVLCIPNYMFKALTSNAQTVQLADSNSGQMLQNPNVEPYFEAQKSGNVLANTNSEKMIYAVYYSNWSPYSPRNHFPHDIDFSRITHVYYSFFVIDEKTGALISSDDYSNFEINYSKKLQKDFAFISDVNPIGNKTKPYTPVGKGLISEFFYLKTSKFLNLVSQNKNENISNFKVLMSVGGWTNRHSFRAIAHDKNKFDNFISSCVDTMFKNGFDGIDIDWEFPNDDGIEPEVYFNMIKLLRESLDKLQNEIYGQYCNNKNCRFQLSVAIPCLKNELKVAFLSRMDEYIDYYNVMAYDLAGDWSEKTEYHSNLFKPKSIAPKLRKRDKIREYIKQERNGGIKNEILSIDEGVQYLINDIKLPASKIILGMPLYGRGFTKVKTTEQSSDDTVFLNMAYKGVGGKSENEPGMWLYNQLPDGKEYFDEQAISAFSFNSKTKTFVGYDNQESMKRKSAYVKNNKLGGGFWWESCGENKTLPLISTFHDTMNVPAAKCNQSMWKSPEIQSYYLKKYGKDALLSHLFSHQDI